MVRRRGLYYKSDSDDPDVDLCKAASLKRKHHGWMILSAYMPRTIITASRTTVVGRDCGQQEARDECDGNSLKYRSVLMITPFHPSVNSIVR